MPDVPTVRRSLERWEPRATTEISTRIAEGDEGKHIINVRVASNFNRERA
jgi:hypothetical protein